MAAARLLYRYRVLCHLGICPPLSCIQRVSRLYELPYADIASPPASPASVQRRRHALRIT